MKINFSSHIAEHIVIFYTDVKENLIFGSCFSTSCRNSYFLYRVSKCLEIKGAPNLAKNGQKAHKKGAQSFSSKKSHILVKSAHFLTPQKFFIAFFCIKFCQISNFLKNFIFCSVFLYFSLIFP